jgi:uncharacterized protein with NRDE domain
MCLIVFAVDPDDEHRLILAGNRDEFHARPTEALRRWDDRPSIGGGRDLVAGGTWLAASDGGRFATVTNSRDAVPPDPSFISRGRLVTDFLTSAAELLSYLSSVDGRHFAGFNLVVADSTGVAYASNRDGAPRRLTSGIYALSNAVLDTRWFKAEYARAAFRRLAERDRLDDDALFGVLASRERAPLDQVHASHLPLDVAHRLSSPFIVGDDYGTRASTLVRMRRDGHITIRERRFAPGGDVSGEDVLEIP